MFFNYFYFLEFKYQFELVEIGKDEKLIITGATALKKRKWLKGLDGLIAKNSGPQDDISRESVAQIKAVKPVSITPTATTKKKRNQKQNYQR